MPTQNPVGFSFKSIMCRGQPDINHLKRKSKQASSETSAEQSGKAASTAAFDWPIRFVWRRLVESLVQYLDERPYHKPVQVVRIARDEVSQVGIRTFEPYRAELESRARRPKACASGDRRRNGPMPTRIDLRHSAPLLPPVQVGRRRTPCRCAEAVLCSAAST